MTSSHQKDSFSKRIRGSFPVDPTFLECSICRDLLWKPTACQSCQVSFCKSCISQCLVNDSIKCPNGCETYTERKCPPIIAKLLGQLKMACFYESDGCEEVMSYDALDKHEIECDYQLKQCPGCELQMLKKEFNTHESSCELIPLTCEDCKFTYKKNEVATKHTENMCLKKQFQQLQKEFEEYKREMYKLTNSPLTQKIITFDDLPKAITVTSFKMPNKYEGLIWTNFKYLHVLSIMQRNPKSGYVTAFIPDHNLQVAFFRETATINRDLPDDTFALVSLTACAAWRDNMQLTISAYRHSVEINNHNIILLFGTPQRVSLQWKNIDKVMFKASGGTAHRDTGNEDGGPFVILTQLTIKKLDKANDNL